MNEHLPNSFMRNHSLEGQSFSFHLAGKWLSHTLKLTAKHKGLKWETVRDFKSFMVLF